MRAWIALALLGVVLVGCADNKMSAPKAKTARYMDAAPSGEAAPAQGRAQDVAPPVEKPQPRMVVYTGRVELIVEDFDEAQAKLAGVVETHKAYVAHSETTGEPHTPRTGKWTLRVPVAGFDALMDAVAGLGEARKRTKDSDDVTDRYFDAKAEVANLEAAEKGLRALYDKKIAGTNMDELLKVNQELTRVRGVINVKLGQMKRWESLTAFSTLEVSMRDRKGYVPPESPEYATQIGRAWGNSIDALVSTGQALFLAAVIVTPWLGPLAILGLVVGLPLRRAYRRRVPTLTAAEVPPAEG